MQFDFNIDKNKLLKKTRGVNFDDVSQAIKNKTFIIDTEHHNKQKHPNQRAFIIEIKNYIYVVPYVQDKLRGVKFLKTVYPSSRLTKKYLKNEKNKTR